MHADLALRMVNELLWTALLTAAPILLVTLVVGLTISVLQVVTQIQETSLTFIPKVVSAGIALIIFGNWMLARVTHFTSQLWGSIPSLF